MVNIVIRESYREPDCKTLMGDFKYLEDKCTDGGPGGDGAIAVGNFTELKFFFTEKMRSDEDRIQDATICSERL